MAVIVGLGLFPAAWAGLLALQRWNGFSDPRFIGTDNFERMGRDTDLVSAAWHTLLYTSVFMPASVVGGLLLAVALNRRIRFMGLYRTAIFVPYVASAAVTGLLANFVFNPEVGVVDNVLRVLGLPQQGWLEDPQQALAVLVLMSMWGQLGFVTVVYLAALQNVDKACLEAAEVDGANAAQRFRHITVPQVAPVTAFVVIWQTIQCIQLFDLVYTTTRGGPIGATTTLVYYLWEQAFRQLNFGYGSAIAWVLFVVSMVMTLFLVAVQRDRGGEQSA
ncbi:MAG: sugar ABC transporter permease [Nocardioides sp.]